MKPFLMIACIVVISSCGSAPEEKQLSSAPPEKAEVITEVAPIEIKAADYYKAYEENQVSADEKYKGKTLLISGKIENISNESGDLTISLKGDGDFSWDVRCIMQKGTDVSTLKKGDKITLKGDGAGSSITPEVENCSIAK